MGRGRTCPRLPPYILRWNKGEIHRDDPGLSLRPREGIRMPACPVLSPTRVVTNPKCTVNVFHSPHRAPRRASRWAFSGYQAMASRSLASSLGSAGRPGQGVEAPRTATRATTQRGRWKGLRGTDGGVKSAGDERSPSTWKLRSQSGRDPAQPTLVMERPPARCERLCTFRQASKGPGPEACPQGLGRGGCQPCFLNVPDTSPLMLFLAFEQQLRVATIRNVSRL